MIGNDQWKRYIYTFDIDKTKKVKNIEFALVADDVAGNFNFTDLQFQEGTSISAPIPATEDILKPVDFNIDEWAFLRTVTNPRKPDPQPVLHENVRNRFYNIVGRGHEVISIPNVFHEDYTYPIVTTGLDLELFAKEDFDLLRIRTNEGGLTDRKYKDIPELVEHPLNYKYTREFFFDGAKAGEKIELKATIRSAKLNEVDVPLKKHELTVKDGKMKIDRQRFMLAPSGSFRLGIEFYKQVTENFGTTEEPRYVTYLKDVGIGYYGVAELNQWTYGVSKL